MYRWYMKHASTAKPHMARVSSRYSGHWTAPARRGCGLAGNWYPAWPSTTNTGGYIVPASAMPAERMASLSRRRARGYGSGLCHRDGEQGRSGNGRSLSSAGLRAERDRETQWRETLSVQATETAKKKKVSTPRFRGKPGLCYVPFAHAIIPISLGRGNECRMEESERLRKTPLPFCISPVKCDACRRREQSQGDCQGCVNVCMCSHCMRQTVRAVFITAYTPLHLRQCVRHCHQTRHFLFFCHSGLKFFTLSLLLSLSLFRVS